MHEAGCKPLRFAIRDLDVPTGNDAFLSATALDIRYLEFDTETDA